MIAATERAALLAWMARNRRELHAAAPGVLADLARRLDALALLIADSGAAGADYIDRLADAIAALDLKTAHLAQPET